VRFQGSKGDQINLENCLSSIWTKMEN